MTKDQGQPGIRTRGTENLWVKKSRRKRVSRLNTRSELRDDHDEELEEPMLVWNVSGEVRRLKECFTTLKDKQRQRFRGIHLIELI